MANSNVAANWVVGKRLVHWGIAVAVVIALVAPKPEHGEGLLHIAAGSTAAALVVARLMWRLLGDVRPYFRDAVKIRPPATSRGARGYAPFLMQIGRLIGFVFLAAIPVAVALALAGIGEGEDSAFLEGHEAAGKAIMFLAIAHAAATLLFAVLMKYDLLGVTLTGGARAFGEGGARGTMGLILGAALGAAALVYVWGPFDVGAKAAAMQELEQGEDEDD